MIFGLNTLPEYRNRGVGGKLIGAFIDLARTLPQATARRVRSEATNNPSPTTISSITSKFELPLVGFPSGQREQTVNLPSSTSKVRILPPPPSLSKAPEFSYRLNVVALASLPDAIAATAVPRDRVPASIMLRQLAPGR